MVKTIKISGYNLEPGWFTHKGQRYRFLTMGQDKKSVLSYIRTFNPDMLKKVIIVNADYTSYLVFGRTNPDIPKMRITEVKTPIKMKNLKSLTRFKYMGQEFRNLYGIDPGQIRTPRGTNFSHTSKQAREGIMYYHNSLVPSETYGYLKPYNDYLIVKVIDNQYNAYLQEK